MHIVWRQSYIWVQSESSFCMDAQNVIIAYIYICIFVQYKIAIIQYGILLSFNPNHPLLLPKLICLGLGPYSINWLQSYPSGCSQVTCVSNSTSSLGSTTSGVTQDSVLGPTVFSYFVNDLPSVLPHDCPALFVDDTTIFLVSNNCRF